MVHPTCSSVQQGQTLFPFALPAGLAIYVARDKLTHLEDAKIHGGDPDDKVATFEVTQNQISKKFVHICLKRKKIY